MKKKKKILFVCMANSPHSARWIKYLDSDEWDIHVYPILYAKPHKLMPEKLTIYYPYSKIHPCIFNLKQKCMLIHHHSFLFVLQFLGNFVKRLFFKVCSILKLLGLKSTGIWIPVALIPKIDLVQIIKQIKPDIIHTMELQHCSYPLIDIANKLPKNFLWLATNWGSDIYYFQAFKFHRKKLKRLLSQIDYYDCECKRDVQLAKDLGFKGNVLPVLPNAGGFNLELLQLARANTKRPSNRKVILVKGYQHWVGNALLALDALEKSYAHIKEFQIIIYSTAESVKIRALNLKNKYNLSFKFMEFMEHDKILDLFGQARIYLGVSNSDGLATSSLEAMSMGAFPIQTKTSCCEEWFEDGVSGFAVPNDNASYISECINRAIKDDKLVNSASEINYKTIITKLDEKKIKLLINKIYFKMLDESNSINVQ